MYILKRDTYFKLCCTLSTEHLWYSKETVLAQSAKTLSTAYNFSIKFNTILECHWEIIGSA